MVLPFWFRDSGWGREDWMGGLVWNSVGPGLLGGRSKAGQSDRSGCRTSQWASDCLKSFSGVEERMSLVMSSCF